MTGLTALGILLAHLVGDYWLQSHWMAVEKVKHWWPAVVHGVTYTIPYVFVTQSPTALLVIASTHIVIDRYRLAKHLGWLKNQIGPKRSRPSFLEAMEHGGYTASTPAWLAGYLLFLTDNTAHLLINTASVLWL